MEECDYLDYHLLAHAYNYNVIPYTMVKQLTYKKNQSKIWMKLDFPDNFIERSIKLKPSKAASIQRPLDLELSFKLSTQKIADIRCMFGIMPESDRLFYENVFAATMNTDVVETDSTNAHFERKKRDNSKVQPKQKPVRSSSAARKSVKKTG